MSYPDGETVGIETYLPVTGDFGNCFYILVRGSVRVTQQSLTLATLGKGTFFGEMTLIGGLPANASVIVVEPVLTIEVPRRSFEQWIKMPGSFRKVMDRTYIDRCLINHLRMIPDFPIANEHLLRELVKSAKFMIYHKDEVIVREGDEADSLFLIFDGYVRVVKAMSGGEQRPIAYLNDGAYFGESALTGTRRRNATVQAMGKVEVIQLMKEDFIKLLSGDTQSLNRFQDTQRRRQEEQQSLASAASPFGFIGQVVEQGVVKATSALVIHLDACTRCGNCVKACAELHHGISRLTRHGMLFEMPESESNAASGRQLVATSCMHCLDPECMIGCPTGAITRDVNGEVVIAASRCIGCGNCARRCPYGNISMAGVGEQQNWQDLQIDTPSIGGYLQLWRTPESEAEMMHEREPGNEKAVVKHIAVKCDLCQDYNYNHGCVHNCPYNAIERMDAGGFLSQIRGAE